MNNKTGKVSPAGSSEGKKFDLRKPKGTRKTPKDKTRDVAEKFENQKSPKTAAQFKDLDRLENAENSIESDFVTKQLQEMKEKEMNMMSASQVGAANGQVLPVEKKQKQAQPAPFRQNDGKTPLVSPPNIVNKDDVINGGDVGYFNDKNMFDTPFGDEDRPQSHLKKRKAKATDDKNEPNTEIKPPQTRTQPVVEPSSSVDEEPLHATDKKGNVLGDHRKSNPVKNKKSS